jgi:hypothetical protein
MKMNAKHRRVSRLIIPPMLAAALAGYPQSATSQVFEQKPNATFQAGQIVGGATRQITGEVRASRGFLPQPELLAAGGPGRPALVYLNPDAKISTYRNVLLHAPIVRSGPGSDLSGIPDSQLRVVANAFYADLYNTLKSKCTLVRTASPNTMRLRFALVDAKIPDAAVNTVATYAPYVSTAYSVASRVFNKGVGYFAGTATVEAFGTDAAKGTLLWEAVDKRGGTTALVADTLDNWRDVRNSFQAWGVQLRTRLQDLGVCRR